MTTTSTEITVGFIITIIAGILNGSWNASFSSKLSLSLFSKNRLPSIEKFDTKLSCSKEQNKDLEFNHAWVLFQFYACLVNILICISWFGGISRITLVLSKSSVTDITLVTIFSFTWGIGSVLFGIACRIAGVGLGTNLTMGVIVILGTFLPLVLNQVIRTLTGLVICIGLVFCCFGLYYSMVSLKIRDIDEMEYNEKEDDTSKNNDKDKENQIEQALDKKHTSAKKVGICIIAGILSSTLQFAFVFGQPIVILARKTPPYSTNESSIIWLFAISVCALTSVLHGLFQIYKTKSSFKCFYLCPPHRHLFIFLMSSLPWVAHIHLYGLAANVYLPEDVAASVGWPILMMITVTQGMILSIVILGEWNMASKKAWITLKSGLGFSLIGIILIMVSLAV